jgi:hypothetical protein
LLQGSGLFFGRIFFPLLIGFASSSLTNAEQGLAYLELKGLSAVHSTVRQKAKVWTFVQSFAFCPGQKAKLLKVLLFV